MLAKAVALHAHHFTSLLFDFRARGLSAGQYCSLGWNETADVLGAVDFVASHPLTRTIPVFCLGESMGGAASILAAAKCHQIRAVVAEASYARLSNAVHQRLGLIGPLRAGVAEECRKWSVSRFQFDFDSVAPADHIGSLAPRPFLQIVDGIDFTCSAGESRALFEAARTPKEQWIVSRAFHVGAFNAAPAEYERRVVQFLNRAALFP